MKIDAYRAVREAGARGDFGAGHAFDEAKDERFAIGFGKQANGLEDGVSFGGGVRSAAVRGRGVVAFEFGRGGFFVERKIIFGAAMKIGGAVAGNGGEPAGKLGSFAERREPREGLEKDVLDEIFGVGRRHAREQNAVDHARVAGVEEAEGGAVAALRGAHQGVIRPGRVGGVGHGEETCAGGAKFEECGHGRIESLGFSLVDEESGPSVNTESGTVEEQKSEKVEVASGEWAKRRRA